MPIAENMGGSIASDLIERRDTLFDAIAHGDDEHRAWLKEAIDAHFAGQPVPECRGKGRKEAALSQLTREVDAYREALTASGETKAEYIGEFSFDLPVGFDRHGNDLHRSFDVPWTTIKEIMAAIRKRALSRSSGGAQ